MNQRGNRTAGIYPRDPRLRADNRLTRHEEQSVKQNSCKLFRRHLAKQQTPSPLWDQAKRAISCFLFFSFFCVLIVGMCPHTAVIGTMQLPPRNWSSQPEFPQTGQAERGNRTEAIRNPTRTQKKANQLREGPPLSRAGREEKCKQPSPAPSFPFHFVSPRGRDYPARSLKQVKTSQLNWHGAQPCRAAGR